VETESAPASLRCSHFDGKPLHAVLGYISPSKAWIRGLLPWAAQWVWDVPFAHVVVLVMYVLSAIPSVIAAESAAYVSRPKRMAERPVWISRQISGPMRSREEAALYPAFVARDLNSGPRFIGWRRHDSPALPFKTRQYLLMVFLVVVKFGKVTEKFHM